MQYSCSHLSNAECAEAPERRNFEAPKFCFFVETADNGVENNPGKHHDSHALA